MRSLVLLRPEPGASASAKRARALGLSVLVRPLFVIHPRAWQAPPPDRFDLLLLTSARAVEQAGPQLRTLAALPVASVGAATAAAARSAGLQVAYLGAAGLDRLLATFPRHLRLLHLAGADRIEPLPGRSITTITVYSSDPADTPDLADVAGQVAALHSPRAARRFAQLIDRARIDRTSLAVVALSEAVAQAAGGGWESVAVAPVPDDAALLALATPLCLRGGR